MSKVTERQWKLIQQAVSATNEGLAEEGAYVFWTFTFVEEFSTPENSRIILCEYVLDENTNKVEDAKWFVITDVEYFVEQMEQMAKDEEVEVEQLGLDGQTVASWIK